MLPLLTIARSAFRLYELNQATGLIGYDDVRNALIRIAAKLAVKSRRIDRGALDDMVARARELVPQDTGLLYSGITGEETDAYFEFRASARRVTASGKSQEDYARFVEFGTAAGIRGASAEIDERSDLYDGTRTSAFVTGSRRRQYRSHPGTQPQPFFYPAADEALARRALDMDDVIAGAAQEDGWEFA